MGDISRPANPRIPGQLLEEGIHCDGEDNDNRAPDPKHCSWVLEKQLQRPPRPSAGIVKGLKVDQRVRRVGASLSSLRARGEEPLCLTQALRGHEKKGHSDKY